MGLSIGFIPQYIVAQDIIFHELQQVDVVGIVVWLMDAYLELLIIYHVFVNLNNLSVYMAYFP